MLLSIQPIRRRSSQPISRGGSWDATSTFVLDNEPYLLTHNRQAGSFGFFRVASDLSVSKPHLFALPRNTPTKGFTTVGPFTSLGQQYVLGYVFDTGTVANFSVTVKPASADGTPPLLALNVRYHQWAKGWTRFDALGHGKGGGDPGPSSRAHFGLLGHNGGHRFDGRFIHKRAGSHNTRWNLNAGARRNF